ARGAACPLALGGGPLTFSNPAPLGPFCDVILLGEGEELVVELSRELAGAPGAARGDAGARAALLARLARRPGYYVSSLHGDEVPAVAQASDDLLPARSVVI